MPPDPPSKKRLWHSIVNRARNIDQEPLHAKRLATPLCIIYCLLFRFCFFMPVDTHKETQKASNQKSTQSGTLMIKLENAGLRAPGSGLRAKCVWALGSGLHSQKRISSVKWQGSGLHSRNFRAPGLQGTPLWDPEFNFAQRTWRVHVAFQGSPPHSPFIIIFFLRSLIIIYSVSFPLFFQFSVMGAGAGFIWCVGLVAGLQVGRALGCFLKVCIIIYYIYKANFMQ